MLVFAVVFPVALFIAGAWFEYGELVEWALGDARGSVDLISAHAAKSIETQEVLLSHLDRFTLTTLNERMDASSAKSLEVEMAALMKGLPQLASLEIIQNGLMVARSGQVSSTSKDLLNDAAETAAGQTDVTRQLGSDQLIFSDDNGGILFRIHRRRIVQNQLSTVILRANLYSHYFEDFWRSAKPTTSIALIRADGEILASVSSKTMPVPRRLPADNSVVKSFGRSDSFHGTSPIDGSESIYAYAQVGKYPLTAFFSLPMSTVLDEWWRNILILGAICGGALLMLSAAVLFAERQLLRVAEEQGRRIRLENAMNSTQRLEILGQLAAGVAHDFANLIQAVGGGARLLDRVAGDENKVRSVARMISDASRRGGTITRRMLDFARKGELDEGGDQTTVPEDALTNVTEILAQLLGDKHFIKQTLPKRSALRQTIQGSRVDFEMVIMNLVINARDAMPEGGTITLSIDSRQIDRQESGAGGVLTVLSAGFYTCVSVSDTGVGMTPDTLAHASEPFFTTKPVGKGTGLGLSGARAFAERAGGALHVDSAPNAGTTVTLWLRTKCDTQPCEVI